MGLKREACLVARLLCGNEDLCCIAAQACFDVTLAGLSKTKSPASETLAGPIVIIDLAEA